MVGDGSAVCDESTSGQVSFCRLRRRIWSIIGDCPGMDMVSVGPPVQSVHSLDERLEVASVPKAYDLLVATLRRIK